jgi:hypothetical protein
MESKKPKVKSKKRVITSDDIKKIFDEATKRYGTTLKKLAEN